jgi:hypothetical protein
MNVYLDESSKYQFYIDRFDQIGAGTHDLPH